MNYNKIYENIIKRAKDRQQDGYTEKHHIIPKCIGGTDDIENIAVLTAREHFIAHQLLIKIYPEQKQLAYAAYMMTRSNSSQHRSVTDYTHGSKRSRANIKKPASLPKKQEIKCPFLR